MGVPDPPRADEFFSDQVPLVCSFAEASLRVLRVERQELAVAAAQYHVKLASHVPVHQLLGHVLATLGCVRVVLPIACGRLRISSCEVFGLKLVFTSNCVTL